MAFRIDPSSGVESEFRRVAGEQFDAALAGLDDPDPDRVEAAVHDARKRCKRLRALLRLVRGSIPERRYRSLDAAVRDAARELSTSRDAAALVKMFDDLLTAHGADPGDEGICLARAGFEARVAALEAVDDSTSPLRRARERLELAAGVAAGTKIDTEGYAALSGGLGDTYGQGAKALGRLARTGSAEDSHEWRKAVKYTWHQLELLEATAPSILEPAAVSFHEVADALGDAHNLAVMVEIAEASPAVFGGREVAKRLISMAEASGADLEARAMRLGLRLYAESPPAFARRLGAYWKVARKAGDELVTGELAEVTRSAPPALVVPAEGEARNLLLVKS